MNATKQAKKLSKKAQARLNRDKQIYASGILRGIDEVKAIVCQFANGEIDREKLEARLKIETNKKGVKIFQPEDGFTIE